MKIQVKISPDTVLVIDRPDRELLAQMLVERGVVHVLSDLHSVLLEQASDRMQDTPTVRASYEAADGLLKITRSIHDAYEALKPKGKKKR